MPLTLAPLSRRSKLEVSEVEEYKSIYMLIVETRCGRRLAEPVPPLVSVVNPRHIRWHTHTEVSGLWTRFYAITRP